MSLLFCIILPLQYNKVRVASRMSYKVLCVQLTLKVPHKVSHLIFWRIHAQS